MLCIFNRTKKLYSINDNHITKKNNPAWSVTYSQINPCTGIQEILHPSLLFLLSQTVHLSSEAYFKHQQLHRSLKLIILNTTTVKETLLSTSQVCTSSVQYYLCPNVPDSCPLSKPCWKYILQGLFFSNVFHYSTTTLIFWNKSLIWWFQTAENLIQWSTDDWENVFFFILWGFNLNETLLWWICGKTTKILLKTILKLI